MRRRAIRSPIRPFHQLDSPVVGGCQIKERHAMMMIRVLLLVIVGCLPLCEGYANGPPTGACGKQVPKHGVAPQTSSPPYKITVSNTTYDRTGNLTVTIESTSGFFDGFFLQARRADCTQNELALGRFFIDERDSTIKLLNCTGDQNAVCHATNSAKTRKSFQWTNPNGGDVYFRSTFVKAKTEFWINVESESVLDSTLNSGKTYVSCNSGANTTSSAVPVKTSNWATPFLASIILSVKLR